ncbi:MAG: FadR family transcriptional regulator [Anaerolineae bacterium]|nr:FadR family transcriptional regulator [Anaerolineae bacterium]
MKELRPIHARSIHQEIQERIKEYILANDLHPGDPLPSETQLAEQLHVSRAVVREALRSLESLGIIRSRRGEGRYVNAFSLDPIVRNLNYSMLFDAEDVWEILDVRERLEAGFIADAIAAMNEETLSRLRELIEKMRQRAESDEEFLEEDLAFHRVIYQVVDNHLLLKLLDVFWDVYKNLRDERVLVVKDLKAEVKNHAEILEAIEAGDAELARQRLVDHFSGIKRRLRAAQLRRPRRDAVSE